MTKRQSNLADIRSGWLITITVVLLSSVSALLPAADNNAGDIVITGLRGEVSSTVGNAARSLRVGGAIDLPANIRTGADGMIDLQQGRTSISISANTTLNIPATATPGAALERIIQTRGSTLYRVGKRTGDKLRVETPYLVAVVKGTQFNVVVQPDNATIALFEGVLEVWSSDGNDVVELNAGEIAIRHGADAKIRVLRMDTGETIRAQLGMPSATPGTDAVARDSDAEAIATPGTLANSVIRIGGSLPSANGSASTSVTGAVTAGGVKVDTRLNIDAAAAGVDIAVGPADTTLSSGATLNLANGSLTATVGVGADLGGVTANLGVDTSVNLGSGNVALNTTTNLAGINAGTGLAVSGGGAELNLGGATLGASVSLPAVNATPTSAITTPIVTPLVITTPVVSTSSTIPIAPVVTAPSATAPTAGGLLGRVAGSLGLP